MDMPDEVWIGWARDSKNEDFLVMITPRQVFWIESGDDNDWWKTSVQYLIPTRQKTAPIRMRAIAVDKWRR